MAGGAFPCSAEGSNDSEPMYGRLALRKAVVGAPLPAKGPLKVPIEDMAQAKLGRGLRPRKRGPKPGMVGS
jgi:hypothetical protein